MKKITNELRLGVDNNTSVFRPKSSAGKFGHVGNTGQLRTNPSSQYNSNVNLFQFLDNNDELDDEEEMNNDDIILELAYTSVENSYRLQELSKYSITSGQPVEIVVLEEGLLGASLDTAIAWFKDSIKNLLSAGAIVISGGAAGDTVVDMIFAVYRTKEVYDAYKDIMAAAGILKDFLAEMDEIELENNIEEIKELAIGKVIQLASLRPGLGEKAVDAISSNSMFKDAHGLFAKVIGYIEDLKQKFVDFLMSMVNSLADWIGTFIPDDFGAGSALFKGVMNDIIESNMDDALKKVTNMIQSLPGTISSTILSKSKLTEFLSDVCDQVSDKLGMKTRIVGIDMKEDVCEKIPEAVEIYAMFMKYIIAFFGVLDGLMDGTIKDAIESGEAQPSGPVNKVGGMELLTNLADLKDDPMAMLDYFYDNQLDLESLTFGNVAESKNLMLEDEEVYFPGQLEGFENHYETSPGFESHYEDAKSSYVHDTSGYPGPSIEESMFMEKAKTTKKYDNHKKLKGKQKTKLPDHLQKAIISSEKNEADEKEEIAEFSGAAAVGGYAVPQPGPNPNKPKSKQKDHHRLSEKEKIVKEQIERMRMLEAYHQKTSNKLK